MQGPKCDLFTAIPFAPLSRKPWTPHPLNPKYILNNPNPITFLNPHRPLYNPRTLTARMIVKHLTCNKPFNTCWDAHVDEVGAGDFRSPSRCWRGGDLPEGWGFTILGFRGPRLGCRVYGQGVRVFGFRVHKKPEDNDTSTSKFQTTEGSGFHNLRFAGL